jgi:hypothetical protein
LLLLATQQKRSDTRGRSLKSFPQGP